MPLTRTFRDTIKARVDRDPEFRVALLTEGVELLLAGDVQTGKAVLRDYINATIGFGELSARTGTSAKSLMRMFGTGGNPGARTLFAVIAQLQKAEAIVLAVNRVA